MQRKRVGGRFVKESVEEKKPEDKPAAVGAPRPRHCRTYTRKRVAEALPEIVGVFLDKAKAGSVPHAKALAALGGLDRGDVVPKVKKQRGKSFAQTLLEELGED